MCIDCGKEFDPADDSRYVGYRGEYTCGDCYDTFVCEDCGKRAYRDDCGDWDYLGNYCEDCFFAKWFQCEICSKYTEYANGDGRYCNDCNPACNEFWNTLVSESSDGRVNFVDWAGWAVIAEFAGTVDFGCGFDCNGKCASTREERGSDWTNETERACCKSCAGEVGYLRRLPREAIATVRALFDSDTGFWRPNGCILPRKWRSYTCLRYRCHCAEENDKTDSADYKELCDCLQKGRLPIVSVK